MGVELLLSTLLIFILLVVKIAGLLSILFAFYLAIAFTSYLYTWQIDQDKVKEALRKATKEDVMSKANKPDDLQARIERAEQAMMTGEGDEFEDEETFENM